jgi:hypothetical protein
MVGWDFEHQHTTNVDTIGSVNFPIEFSTSGDMNGVLGGIQSGGVDWQFDPHWLVGIGGDFDWTDLKAKSAEHGGRQSGCRELLP